MFVRRRRLLNFGYRVAEAADPRDFYLDNITFLEGEGIRWYNARAGEQDRSGGKNLASEKVLREFAERTSNAVHGGLFAKHNISTALNLQANDPSTGFDLGSADQYAWSQGTGAPINLRLRQVQEILAFDIARAHVIPDGKSDQSPVRIENQGQLGFGHAPPSVATDADGFSRRHHFAGH